MSLNDVPNWVVNSGIAGIALFLGYKIAMRLIDQLAATNTAIQQLTTKITEVCTMLSDAAKGTG